MDNNETFCALCGGVIKEDENYCRKCGTSRDATPDNLDEFLMDEIYGPPEMLEERTKHIQLIYGPPQKMIQTLYGPPDEDFIPPHRKKSAKDKVKGIIDGAFRALKNDYPPIVLDDEEESE